MVVHHCGMLMFLASVLEQMDVASEHIGKRDVHDARFGLLLTDNAIELVLHRIATAKAADMKAYRYVYQDYPHRAVLEEALGAQFEPKLRFAKLTSVVSDQEAETIAILHRYRNQVYHVGIQHEAILPDIASMYFDTVCGVLQRWNPGGFWWSSNHELPERARKYFTGKSVSFPGSLEDFADACRALVVACDHDAAATIHALADHADQVSDADVSLDIVAQGIYDNQRRSRDQAIREIQAWPLAFTDKGRKFAAARGWTGTNAIDLSDWLGREYPVRFRRDPIPSWRKRVEKLHQSKTAPLALPNYHSFMRATEEVRDALSETARQIDDQIDMLVDAARGK
jgi:hypothetical protein